MKDIYTKKEVEELLIDFGKYLYKWYLFKGKYETILKEVKAFLRSINKDSESS